MPQYLTHFSARRKWYPLGMSCMLHTLLMTWLMWWYTASSAPIAPAEAPRQAAIVLAHRNLSNLAVYLTQQDIWETPLADASPASTAQSSAGEIPEISSDRRLRVNVNLDAAGQTAFPTLISDAQQLALVPQKAPSSGGYELTAEDLALIEADRKLLARRQPVGPPANIQVFGSGKLTGHSFVFVLDRSQSMGSQGLGVVQASRIELSRAVAALQPHHHFQIIGYHNSTVLMSNQKLLAGTAQNKSLVPDYIDSLVAYGGTNHEAGLVAALALQPDIIVLMTDGGEPKLHDGQLALLHRIAGDHTQIHCLQFGAGPLQSTHHFMIQLAAGNHGTFRYLDVNLWKKLP